MAEHWCKEHKQPFFKKGKMKGFAHPILDEDGEPAGEWCNEPKVEGEKSGGKPQGDTNASIEAQVAYKGAIELMVHGVLVSSDLLFIEATNWALVRLGSLPLPTPKPETKETAKETPKVSSGATRESVLAYVAMNKGWKTDTPALSYLINKHKVSEERLDREPDAVLAEIKEIEGW